MALSRRGFLTHSTISAASVPFLLGLDINYCDASPTSTVDWSMGFPKDAVLLNRNENPIGPSPLAIEAANKGISRSFRYADPDYIRTLLAEHHGIDKEYLLVGTGSGELLKLADALPKQVLLVIDEAYVHFQADGKTGIDLVKEGYGNVLVTRTFSKAYALAGLRCGHGIGHPDIMRKIAEFGCGPTSTNMAGFGAAIASLKDQAHLERSRKFVSKARSFYEKNFRELGISYVSGPPIFILAEFGKKTTAIRDELRKKKIFVRDGVEWALPDHIRISYGYEKDNQAFFSELKNLI